MLNEGQETAQWTQVGAYPIPFAGTDYADGIRTVDNGQWTMGNAIYNLAGQRVSKVQQGRIYIVNGKKVLF